MELRPPPARVLGRFFYMVFDKLPGCPIAETVFAIAIELRKLGWLADRSLVVSCAFPGNRPKS